MKFNRTQLQGKKKNKFKAQGFFFSHSHYAPRFFQSPHSREQPEYEQCHRHPVNFNVDGERLEVSIEPRVSDLVGILLDSITLHATKQEKTWLNAERKRNNMRRETGNAYI